MEDQRKWTVKEIQLAKRQIHDILAKHGWNAKEGEVLTLFGFHTATRYDYYPQGQVTTYAFMTQGCQFNTLKSAKAEQSIHDEYNPIIGRLVALCKLVEEPVPKWVYGTGKNGKH